MSSTFVGPEKKIELKTTESTSQWSDILGAEGGGGGVEGV